MTASQQLTSTWHVCVYMYVYVYVCARVCTCGTAVRIEHLLPWISR